LAVQRQPALGGEEEEDSYEGRLALDVRMTLKLWRAWKEGRLG
jgi:hypothetical protein